MAVTVTRTQVRQEMLRRVPLLGRALTATAVTKSGPSITHAAEYERQRAGLTSFEGQYVHRYNLADPDRWRLITTLNQPTTDGIINVDGPAYADNADMAYERLTVHPDDLNFAIAEGQRRQKVLTNIALTGAAVDLNMEFAGAHYWGDPAALGGSQANSTTVAKTSSDVHSGTQALLCIATADVAGIWGESIKVTPGRLLYMACIVRTSVLVGSLTFGIRDSNGGAILGSVTISGTGGGDWMLAEVRVTLPSTTNTINPFFTSSKTNDAYIVDTCFGPYQAGQTEHLLPTAINEAYKLRFVRPSRFNYALSTAGFYDAGSIEFIGDLTSPEDWNAEIFRRDTVANRLRFVANSYNNNNVGWGLPSGGSFMSANMRPIWLAMEAKVSDFEPLLTELSVTSQDLDECVCFSLRSLFETLDSRADGKNPVWAKLLADYASWSAAESVARPPQARMPPKRLHRIRA